ncbi:MAG: DNA repair protein RecO [Janthinobacterium lividum]
MPAYTTDAIVLRRRQFSETDNIITLYSPGLGRFSAIAKGARKAISRLSGATEVLTCTRFGMASGKSLEIVTQVEVQESFSALRQDLTRLAHGLYLADLVEHSVEDHAPNPVLYDLFFQALHQTQDLTVPELAARWFEIQLLSDLGYAPDLFQCAICQTPVPGSFARDEVFALSAALGGALCPRHAHPESIEDHSGLGMGALRLLQTLEALGPEGSEVLEALPAAGPKSLDHARLGLRRSLRFRLERDLKSLEFLDSLRIG